MRPAVAERHAEALRVADDRVGAHLARRRDERQRQQIASRPRPARPPRAPARSIGRRSTIPPRSSGYCSSRPNARDSASSDSCADRRPRARMSSGSARPRSTSSVCGKQPFDDQKHALPARRRRLLRLQAMEHRHRLGRRRALVEERRRRDVHAGQILDDRLEVQQRLEPALRDLRLIRRVRRVPAGILEHVPQDDARRDAAVVAQADVGAGDGVARRDRRAGGGDIVLGLALGQVERRVARMPGGIVWSISASSDGTPIAASIAARSAASGPMCLDWKEPGVWGHRAMLNAECSMLNAEVRTDSRGDVAATSSSRCTAPRPADRRRRRSPSHDHPRLVRVGVHRLRLLAERRLTSVTSPLTGAYSSETALTDSIVPKTSPFLSCGRLPAARGRRRRRAASGRSR